MGTLKIGSSKDKKGTTIEPSFVLFNGNNVKKIMSDTTKIWGRTTIYNRGNQYTDITGGWSVVYANGYYGFNKDHMAFNATVVDYVKIHTNNKINLSEYSKICMECGVFKGTDQYHSFTLKTHISTFLL